MNNDLKNLYLQILDAIEYASRRRFDIVQLLSNDRFAAFAKKEGEWELHVYDYRLLTGEPVMAYGHGGIWTARTMTEETAIGYMREVLHHLYSIYGKPLRTAIGITNVDYPIEPVKRDHVLKHTPSDFLSAFISEFTKAGNIVKVANDQFDYEGFVGEFNGVSVYANFHVLDSNCIKMEFPQEDRLPEKLVVSGGWTGFTLNLNDHSMDFYGILKNVRHVVKMMEEFFNPKGIAHLAS